MRLLKLKCRYLLGLFGFLLFSYVLLKIYFPKEFDRRILLQIMRDEIASENDSFVCKPPNLPIYSPQIMKFIRKVPPIDCKASGINWVKCKGSICSITEEAKILYGNIKCRFSDILRVNDFENSLGKSVFTNNTYQLVDSDVVKVTCTAGNHKWSAVLTAVRKNDTIWKESSWNKLHTSALKMNVLMFGIDSISRLLFMRKLPKTYDFITKKLKGVVLEGYNIVGDGTPQALIPILTGKNELELPDTRRRFSNSFYVNSYPFIWNEFKKRGYVTAYLEDSPDYGIFTHRLKGFKEPPTDHYMRPYYLSSADRKWPKFCTGNTPNHKVMTNFIKDFFHVYQAKPKFMFGFQGELSHDDYNLVGAADEDFKEFLEDLNDNDALNNTILIVFADHGHRFAKIRNTLQGKQEERLPFFSITLPPWFRVKYPEFEANLRNNVKKLTTPFDVHATLRGVLNREVNMDEDRTARSLSMFSEIPSDRTCSKAFIEPHWCACLEWRPLHLSEPLVSRLARHLVNELNALTEPRRRLCDTWSLIKVNWASKLAPNDKMMRFKQNADSDGFLADLTGETSVEVDTYQIGVQLAPDAALFEASVHHNLKKDSFTVSISDISRINRYGRQSRCIEDMDQDLRKFCHCRN